MKRKPAAINIRVRDLFEGDYVINEGKLCKKSAHEGRKDIFILTFDREVNHTVTWRGSSVVLVEVDGEHVSSTYH